MKSVNIEMIIFSMAGGLALFLFGMKVLSQGLQMAAGDKLKKLLEKLTDNKLKGVGIGALVTAIIQSSSITTVTLVGLINAGIIDLGQAVPVIMGANIGTTVTAQLIAFKVGKFALPIIALGFLAYSVCKKDMHKYLGQVLLGFGILFLGMNLMSSEAKSLVHDQYIMDLMIKMGQVPAWGILAGTIFTGIIQSSSATSGLVISMGMGSEKLMSLNAAVAIILGANIGTCVTVGLASLGSTLSSKRAALCHVLFNILGVLIFAIIFSPFIAIVKMTSGSIGRQIANAHLIFNITTTLVLLPLSAFLISVVKKVIPGEEIKVEEGPKYLDEHTLQAPGIALAMAEKETIRMARIALSMIEASRIALFDRDAKQIEVVKQKEKAVDTLDDAIEIFMSKIDKEGLSEKQQVNLAVLTHAISDIERIGDHANNICELASQRIERKVRFSEEAFEELKEVFEKTDLSVMKCIDVIKRGDLGAISEIKRIEQDVDQMVIQMEQNHLERLEQGLCTPNAGPVYLDVLRNLERITDHTHNIACAKSIGF